MATATYEAWSGYLNYGGGTGIALQLILSSTSNGPQANTSTISYWLRWTKKGTSDGGYSYSYQNSLILKINNTTLVDTANWGRVDINGIPAGGYIEFKSGAITVPHDANGNASVSYYARFRQTQRSDCDYIIDSASSGNFIPDKINRYASVTLAVTGTTKNSITVKAATSLPCKIFNFQYYYNNQWLATDNDTAKPTPAAVYSGKNTTTYTHTYQNLKYATSYKFRCLVTTTAGMYTGSGGVTPVSGTTKSPAPVTLTGSALSPGSNLAFSLNRPDSGASYRMEIRIGSKNGTLLHQDSSNQTAASRSIPVNWNTIYSAYFRGAVDPYLHLRKRLRKVPGGESLHPFPKFRLRRSESRHRGGVY